MVKPIAEAAVLAARETERTWTQGGAEVLRATLSVPECREGLSRRAQRRFNRYYRQSARAFLFYCAHTLYPEALAARAGAGEGAAAPLCARASMTFTVTYNARGLLSLYLDCTERAGTPEALTLRRADTWELKTGYPIAAADCFPKGTHLRALCLAHAREECRRRREAGLSAFAPDLSRRLRRALSLRNFYLSEEGFHFFYQPWAIAPGFEGCPTFLLPLPEADGAQASSPRPGEGGGAGKKNICNTGEKGI